MIASNSKAQTTASEREIGMCAVWSGFARNVDAQIESEQMMRQKCMQQKRKREMLGTRHLSLLVAGVDIMRRERERERERSERKGDSEK